MGSLGPFLNFCSLKTLSNNVWEGRCFDKLGGGGGVKWITNNHCFLVGKAITCSLCVQTRCGVHCSCSRK